MSQRLFNVAGPKDPSHPPDELLITNILRMPAEIRNQIYDHLIQWPFAVDLDLDYKVITNPAIALGDPYKRPRGEPAVVRVMTLKTRLLREAFPDDYTIDSKGRLVSPKDRAQEAKKDLRKECSSPAAEALAVTAFCTSNPVIYNELAPFIYGTTRLHIDLRQHTMPTEIFSQLSACQPYLVSSLRQLVISGGNTPHTVSVSQEARHIFPNLQVITVPNHLLPGTRNVIGYEALPWIRDIVTDGTPIFPRAFFEADESDPSQPVYGSLVFMAEHVDPARIPGLKTKVSEDGHRLWINAEKGTVVRRADAFTPAELLEDLF